MYASEENSGETKDFLLFRFRHKFIKNWKSPVLCFGFFSSCVKMHFRAKGYSTFDSDFMSLDTVC